MPSNTVIKKQIRETLDAKRKVMGRVNPDTDPYQSASKNKKSYIKNISRTPYVTMTSEALIQDKSSIKRAVDEEKDGIVSSDTTKAAAVKQAEFIKNIAEGGVVTLSNQEYSKDRSDINYGDISYNARGGRNRPTAGITGLTSDYQSSQGMKFIKRATVNWTCHSLEDLTALSERFLAFGARVYVEFGWVLPGSDKQRTTFINEKGQLQFSVAPDERTINTALAKRVIEEGKGNFEAFIGRIESFDISSREDGGFDCTTSVMAGGIDVLNAPVDTNPAYAIEGTDFLKWNEDLSRMGFQNALSNLPNSMLDIIKTEYEEGKGKPLTIYDRLEEADSIREYEEGAYYNKDTGKKVTEEELEKDEYADIQKKKRQHRKRSRKYRYYEVKGVGFNGFEQKTKQIFSNKNLLVINTTGYRTDDYRRPAGFNEDEQHANDIHDIGGFAAITTPGKESRFKIEGMSADKTQLAIDPNECWVRWGWFEDNLLNKYFSLVSDYRFSEFRTNNEAFLYPEVEIRSIQDSKAEVSEDVKYLMTKFGWTEQEAIESLIEAKEKNRQNNGSPNYLTGAPGKESGKESTRVKTHKDFRTTNFKEFVFPGKFNYEREQNKIRKLREEASQNIKSYTEQRDKAESKRLKEEGEEGTIPSDDELRFDKQVKFWENQLENTFVTIDGVEREVEELTIDEMIKTIDEYKITDENYNLRETGIVSTLTLIYLTYRFAEMDSFEVPDNDEEGYLRNIFINVGMLQSIFTGGGSTTLAENFNRLSKRLQSNSLKLITLKAENDPDTPGTIKFDSAGFTKSDADFIKKSKHNGDLYVFPVWQNDSIVIGQNISTDLNSELQKVEYIKDIANQPLTDDGISLYAQYNFNSNNLPLDEEEEESEDDKAKAKRNIDLRNLRPVFLQEPPNWFKYGQKDGDASIPLRQYGGELLWEDDWNPIDFKADEAGKKAAEEAEKQRKKQSADADTQGDKIAANLSGYNQDGTMNVEEHENMEKNIKEKPDKNGRPVTSQDEYGLIFISNEIELSGIAGIKPGDIWTTNYLPKKFRERAHFWTKNVEHKVDSSGWHTTITGQMCWSLNSE